MAPLHDFVHPEVIKDVRDALPRGDGHKAVFFFRGGDSRFGLGFFLLGCKDELRVLLFHILDFLRWRENRR